MRFVVPRERELLYDSSCDSFSMADQRCCGKSREAPLAVNSPESVYPRRTKLWMNVMMCGARAQNDIDHAGR
jgi:hypothetical protein